jgi:hypothetical protein
VLGFFSGTNHAHILDYSSSCLMRMAAGFPIHIASHKTYFDVVVMFNQCIYAVLVFWCHCCCRFANLKPTGDVRFATPQILASNNAHIKNTVTTHQLKDLYISIRTSSAVRN